MKFLEFKFFFGIKAAENRRQAAIARRVVSLQRRVRLWLERRRELKKQQQKELEEQMLKDALEAEEEEAVINERSYLFTFPAGLIYFYILSNVVFSDFQVTNLQFYFDLL